MVARKQYPLRIDPQVWGTIERWAEDDMRSANGQIEWILRRALSEAGRLPRVDSRAEKPPEEQKRTQNSLK